MVERLINVNDKRRIKESMTMIRKRKLCSDIEAESGAERLEKLLEAPECRRFFIKVMYYLPYDERERILESAIRPGITSPKKYFTHSARKALEKAGC